MSDKLNTEDIKLLIPDYITGSLSETENKIVEEGLAGSAELRQFYVEMKGTFEFVSKVKFEEPSPQYWNSLLPRIHEKIDARQSRKSFWAGIPVLWKIVVPVAAVIVVFFVYQILKSPGNQITKDENKLKNENTVKDSSKLLKSEPKEEIKQPVEQPEDKAANNEEKDNQIPKVTKQNRQNYELKSPDENVAQDNNRNNEDEININHDNEREELASVDPDDLSIMASSSPGAIDEETEHELNKLDNNEKDELLQELMKSNL